MVALLNEENGTELRSRLTPQAQWALSNLPLSWKHSGLRFQTRNRPNFGYHRGRKKTR
jgi:hypothetical protein